MEVPSLTELSLEKQWPVAIQDPEFKNYIPDTWLKTPDGWKKADRDYFWVIFSTLNEFYVYDLVADVR